MLKRAVGRAMWFGGKVSAVFGLALAMALVLGIGAAALAAVPGDPFRLGQNNVINNAITSLVGSRAGGAMMLVDNNSSAAGSRALDLRAEPGRAPLTVNPDAGKAPNLSADELDGKDQSAFFSGGTYRVFDSLEVDPGESGTFSSVVICDPGDKVLGGGGRGPLPGDDLLSSQPAFEDRWGAEVRYGPGNARIISVTALCADFPPLRP